MAGNDYNGSSNIDTGLIAAALSPEELDALGDAVHGAFVGQALTPEQRLRHLRRIRALAGPQQPRGSGIARSVAHLGDGGQRIIVPPPLRADETRRRWWQSPVMHVAGMAASLAVIALVAALLVVVFRPLGNDAPDDRTIGVIGEGSPTSVPNEFIPAGGEVTFSAPQGSKTQMLLVNADGSFARPILTNDANFWLPTWSPDGKQVAFASEDPESGTTQIYVMNADGSVPVQLTTREGGNGPVWSPDGVHIAYQAWIDNRTGLYVVPVDRSTGQRNVSGTLKNPWHARWSPDGTQLAFESENVIYVTDITDITGDTVVMPRRLAEGASPEWSPDGTRIAYFAWDSGDADLFVANVDGSGITNLTDTEPLNEFTPVWSPDGRWIAYSVDARDAIMRLNLIDADGANPRQVADFESRSPIFAAWSADSRQIAFTGQPNRPATGDETSWTLSIVNTDGSNEHELFSPVSANTHPVWRPDWWSKGAVAGTPDTDAPTLKLSATSGACNANIQAVGKNLEPDTLVRIFAGAIAVSDPDTVGNDGTVVTEIDLRALSACGPDAAREDTDYTFSVYVDRGTTESNEGIRQTEDELTGASTTFTVLAD